MLSKLKRQKEKGKRDRNGVRLAITRGNPSLFRKRQVRNEEYIYQWNKYYDDQPPAFSARLADFYPNIKAHKKIHTRDEEQDEQPFR
jgi:hypothetical protein